MKPLHWLAFGSAIGVSTAALGFYLIIRPAPVDPTPPPVDGPNSLSRPPAARNLANSVKPRRGSAVERPVSRASEESHTQETGFRILGTPPAGLASEESVWFAHAERVEREANLELETLKESLELSPYQEQRIFGILARRSSSWMPGMDAGASHAADSAVGEGGPANSAASVTDEILPLLDEEQQQALIDEELDRRVWWEEVLPQLLPPEFPVDTGSEEVSPGVPGVGETKAYEGPTEMLEE
jgi:hypothetical protein